MDLSAKASRGKRDTPKRSAAPAPQPQSKSKRLITLGLSVATVAVLIGSIVVTSIGGRGGGLSFDAPDTNQATVLPAKTIVNTTFELEPKTLNELLNYSDGDHAKVDIARMNLLCASDMPSTEGLDIEHALSVLDEWAEKVAEVTDRHLYRVNDPRPIYRDRYNGSEAHMRAEFLAQVLQEDLGVKYNLSAKDNFSFADPSVAFIHGMIPAPGQTTADTPGGTCASMPVLYVAVGRRLGYPLKLVTAHSHLFARWDGEAMYKAEGGHDNPAWRETFNCETTNGFHKYDDDKYRTWPYPVTEAEIARNGLLKSLSPREEFAQFLGARGHHGVDVGAVSFAARCYENAYRNDPSRPCYRSWFMHAAMATGYQPATAALHHMLAVERTHREAEKRRQAAGGTPGVPLPSQIQQQALGGIPSPGGVATATPQPAAFRSPHTVNQPFQPPPGPAEFSQPPQIPE
jgi:hypothetical protein